jgi:hypothetical protein
MDMLCIESRTGRVAIRSDPEAAEAAIKIERLGLSSKALNEFPTTI